MKNNKMTREEKRRLLFNKKYEKKQRKFENRRTKVMFRNRILVTVLAVVFALSGIVTVLVSALDGKGYEDITTVIFDNTNSYTVPEEGIARGTWFKYSRDNKQYVFQAEYDLIPGDTLTLEDKDTIDVFHDPTGGDTQNKYNLLTYATLTSSNPYTFNLNEGTATYDEDGNVVGYTDNILRAGQRYYFTPDGTTYYSFTPTEDIGYEWIETREQGIYTQKTLGDLTITIDPNASDPQQQFSAQGNKYTRKVIYELTDTLDSNGVYLITAVYDNKEYMLRYGNQKAFSDGYDNYDITAGGIKPDCPSWEHAKYFLIWYDQGEYVYTHTNKLVTQTPGPVDSVPQVETRIATSPTEDDKKFYDYDRTIAGTISDKMVPQTHSYYYDGDDGSLDNDIYVFSEFSTYRTNVPQGLIAWLLTEGSGNYLMGYDGDGSSYEQDAITTNNSHKGYYTSGKALGTIYTLNPSYAKILLIHEACTMGVVNHNYGNMWDYNNTTHRLENKNLSVGSFGFASILTFNPSNGFSLATSNNVESDTLIYRMKDVYTHESINQQRPIAAETKGHSTIDTMELENITVTFSYTRTDAQNKEFPVTFTLTDEDGNPVSGKWSTDTLTFIDGVYTTSMKSGDAIPFTNIPKGYSMNVSVTLPDGSGDDNKLYYSSTIDGQTGTVKNIDIQRDRTGTNAVPILITDTRKDACVRLEFSGDNADLTQTFPVTLKLTKADDTPVSGAFLGEDTTGATTTYVFDENGECVINSMSKDHSLDVFVPDGYNLTTTVTLPNATYYTSSVYGRNGNTATVIMDADKDIPIVITSVKERVTVNNETVDNPEQSGYSDSSREFPLKMTLYYADGETPYSGDFMGTDGTTVYTFDSDGVCTNTVELAHGGSISMFLPKNTVLKVEDAETASGYTTTYSDPTANDSSTPLNTTISNDGIQITVKHTADVIVITGLLEESETQGLAIAGAVIGVGMAAGVAYVYRKKDEFI